VHLSIIQGILLARSQQQLPRRGQRTTRSGRPRGSAVWDDTGGEIPPALTHGAMCTCAAVSHAPSLACRLSKPRPSSLANPHDKARSRDDLDRKDRSSLALNSELIRQDTDGRTRARVIGGSVAAGKAAGVSARARLGRTRAGTGAGAGPGSRRAGIACRSWLDVHRHHTRSRGYFLVSALPFAPEIKAHPLCRPSRPSYRLPLPARYIRVRPGRSTTTRVTARRCLYSPGVAWRICPPP
jgi:hypothetical protein